MNVPEFHDKPTEQELDDMAGCLAFTVLMAMGIVLVILLILWSNSL